MTCPAENSEYPCPVIGLYEEMIRAHHDGGEAIKQAQHELHSLLQAAEETPEPSTIADSKGRAARISDLRQRLSAIYQTAVEHSNIDHLLDDADSAIADTKAGCIVGEPRIGLIGGATVLLCSSETLPDEMRVRYAVPLE